MGDGGAGVRNPVRAEESSVAAAEKESKSWVFSGDASIGSGRFPWRLSTFEIETTFDYVYRVELIRAKNPHKIDEN